LREQLELQQVSINTLQTQLSKAKEDLAVATVEKEHLSNRLLNNVGHFVGGGGDGGEADALRKKVSFVFLFDFKILVSCNKLVFD